MPEKAARLTAPYKTGIAPVFAPPKTVFDTHVMGEDYDLRVVIAVSANNSIKKRLWHASDRPQLHAINGRVC